MKIQKSFDVEKPTLFIVATPIGNLTEMTPRAIQILKSVHVIAAEDTRNTKKIVDHFSIETPLIAYHQHNEIHSTQGILKLLKEGKDVALVSDAGYPLISDPGQTLVNEIINHDFHVVPISGSNALLNALVVSGIVTQPFTFLGFLEAKGSALKNQLEDVKNIKHTLVFYVSVHKIEKTLQTVYDILGNRNICLAREITKMHEEFIRTDLASIVETDITLKGEFVLVVEGNLSEDIIEIETLLKYVDEAIEDGLSPSRAISKISKDFKISKNELYNAFQTNKE